jgi:TonB family protein
MGLSNIAAQVRVKEVEKLRFLLLRSLITSVFLHVGVLMLGVSNFWLSKISPETEPIEVAVIELPPTEQKPVQSPDAEKISSGGGGGGRKLDQLLKSAVVLANNSRPSQPSVKLKQQTSPSIPKTIPQTQPVEAVENHIKPQPISPVRTSTPVITQQPESQSTEVSKPEIAVKPDGDASLVPTPPALTPKSSLPFSSDRWRSLLAEARNNLSPTNTTTTGNQSISNNAGIGTPTSNNITGTGSGSGTGNSIGNGSGTGNSIGNGSGTGNGIGNGSGTGNGIGSGSGTGNFGNEKPPEEQKIAVAPAPKTPPVPTTNSKLNPADCQECKIKYPESARRRGIEGNPEVSVDYNDKGIVTKVILRRSSGSEELDNALIEQAKNFQLKPSEGGRTGVRVLANFAIQGSRRYRQLRDRQTSRQRQRENSQSNSNQTETKPAKSSLQNPTADSSPDIQRRQNLERTLNNDATPHRRLNSDHSQTKPKKRPSGESSSNLEEKPPVHRRLRLNKLKPRPTEERPTEEASNKFRRLREALNRNQPANTPAQEQPVSSD